MLLTNEVAMDQYPKVLIVESFMEAGLVSYADNGDGVYLLRKETLDKMISTLEGRPVIVGHQSVDLSNLEDVAVGYVIRGFFNEWSGKYDCEILIKDSDIYNAIKLGNNKVSSAYVSDDIVDGGLYNGQKYDYEIKSGTFTHLAIVDSPRYQDAKIIVNSMEGKKMTKLFKFFNTDKKKVESDEEMFVEIDGKDVALTALIAAYMKSEKDLENACKTNEDEIEVDGEKKIREEMEKEEKREEEEKKEEVKEEKENETSEEKEESKEEDKKEEEKENEEEDKKEDKEEDKEEKQNEVSDSIKNYINTAIKEAITAFNNELNSDNANALKLRAAKENGFTSQDKRFATRQERIESTKGKYSL